MKKIYSFIAALVVAMVVLASCNNGMVYKSELDNAKVAFEKKDWSAVDKACSTIFTNKDKASAIDLAFAFVYQYNACFNKFGEDALSGRASTFDEYIAGYQKSLQILDAAKAKPDYEEALKVLEIIDVDVAQTEIAAKNSLETLQNAAAKARSAAEEEKAQDEE